VSAAHIELSETRKAGNWWRAYDHPGVVQEDCLQKRTCLAGHIAAWMAIQLCRRGGVDTVTTSKPKATIKYDPKKTLSEELAKTPVLYHVPGVSTNTAQNLTATIGNFLKKSLMEKHKKPSAPFQEGTPPTRDFLKATPWEYPEWQTGLETVVQFLKDPHTHGPLLYTVLKECSATPSVILENINVYLSKNLASDDDWPESSEAGDD
jgi:hypothetical protein